MLFELNVKLTDEDYFEFNKFWMIKSHYGRSQMLKMRVMIAVLFILSIFVFGMGDGVSTDTLIYSAPTLIALLLFQILCNKMMECFLKAHLKSLKKKGKMGYSPESTLIFSDETLSEITPAEKSERRYATLERVSIVGDRVMYLHINSVGAYIVPMSSFSTTEECAAFIEFIKTKCQYVDVY